MRTNLPITNTELKLQPGRPIVTKTDLQGNITYANDSFVDISGFSRDELIGENHNIVRHPDMPPAAFADLWRTVLAGQPWRGLVKNRTKTGDYYWVEAFVTPILEQGRIVGFMSVRNPPDEGEVREADARYRAIREGTVTLPPTSSSTKSRRPCCGPWPARLPCSAWPAPPLPACRPRCSAYCPASSASLPPPTPTAR